MENLLKFNDIHGIFYKKRVVIIGSAPSALDNTGDHIEDFDLIVRVNNYKTRGLDYKQRPYDFTDKVGTRTDYHFSFYGGSIKKKPQELIADGVKGHLCKCPDDICHVTQWHKDNNCEFGGNFKWIYKKRSNYWIAPVYIPKKSHYLDLFNLLGQHVPSTGFAGIWEMLNCQPKELYVTGFDFMTSGLHNTNEKWKDGDPNDPIRHLFSKERELFYKWYYTNECITLDKHLENGKYK